MCRQPVVRYVNIHPLPQRSLKAIFRPEAGSDFISNIHLSLPLSDAERSRQPPRPKRWSDGEAGRAWKAKKVAVWANALLAPFIVITVLSFQFIIYVSESCGTDFVSFDVLFTMFAPGSIQYKYLPCYSILGHPESVTESAAL